MSPAHEQKLVRGLIMSLTTFALLGLYAAVSYSSGAGYNSWDYTIILIFGLALTVAQLVFPLP